MSLPLQVSGYDKQTERLEVCHPVPPELAEAARALAHVDPLDDGEGAYPLDVAATIALSVRMDGCLNAELFDWVLEPAIVDCPRQ